MATSKLAVGLDIGSSSVKLVHVKEKRGGFSLQAFGTAPLPPEAIVDGALMNSAAIVEAIQEVVAAQRRARNNVQRLREEQLLTKAELARKAGLSPLTVSRIESGLECRMDTQRKIILALGLTPLDRHKVFGRSNGG